MTGRGSVKSKGSDLFTLAWAQMFHLPVMLGAGEHWPLTKAEAKQLGDASDGWVKSLPKKQRDGILKAMERFMPSLVMLGTAAIVTYPRLMIEAQRIEANRRNARDRAAYAAANRAPGPAARPRAASGETDESGERSTAARAYGPTDVEREDWRTN